MFSTTGSVRTYTNKEVTLDVIKRAQAIVEIFVGKDEIDIENPSDLLVLDKMTAYQAAYMMDNEDVVYSQIASISVGSGDTAQNFDTNMSSPWIAPLAVMAAKALSFKKPRSIRTGKIFQRRRLLRNDWIKY
jgi:hypothetical protein